MCKHLITERLPDIKIFQFVIIIHSYEHRRSHESISKIMQEESMAYIAVSTHKYATDIFTYITFDRMVYHKCNFIS